MDRFPSLQFIGSLDDLVQKFLKTTRQKIGVVSLDVALATALVCFFRSISSIGRGKPSTRKIVGKEFIPANGTLEMPCNNGKDSSPRRSKEGSWVEIPTPYCQLD